MRHILVTVFVMSNYSSTNNRLSKPFNPLLGETFEYVNEKVKIISEQVSHHPPVSATYALSQDGSYEYFANTESKQ